MSPDLAGVVPRWEWRTFGREFGAAEEKLAALTRGGAQDSDETYLLSLESDASVKVRDGTLDVKRLEQVDADGLEQWRPVMKSRFPLAAADASSVLSMLGIAGATPTRETYTLDEFLAEVAEANEILQAVEVHKHRQRYSVGGCMAEVTDVQAGSSSTRTIAIESEDPSLVVATRRELGFTTERNVSVPRGLKRLVGFEEVRYAVIDVGTNSVKFHVGELRGDGTWRTIVDRAEITRLGERLATTGRLNPEPIERTVGAITAMADEARAKGAKEIAAVGTAGMRIAPNSDELIAAVRRRCGIEIEVIDGEEEARLAYIAAVSGLDLSDGSLVVFDTGGGSSQFTFGHGKDVDERFSVDVGAVRITERYGLDGVVSDDRLSTAFDAVAADLERLDGRTTPDALIAIGGAVTNIAAVKHELPVYDADVVQGTVLDRREIDRQIELYRTSTVEVRRRIPGLQTGRADVILAGACIIRTVLEKLERTSLTVSVRGLRHGLLAERFAFR